MQLFSRWSKSIYFTRVRNLNTNHKNIFFVAFIQQKEHQIYWLGALSVDCGTISPLPCTKFPCKKTFPHSVDTHFFPCYTDLIKSFGEQNETNLIRIFDFADRMHTRLLQSSTCAASRCYARHGTHPIPCPLRLYFGRGARFVERQHHFCAHLCPML